jgi:branched-subunit amino acid transport protein
MTMGLLPLAILMGLATFPWRAVPLLAPGIDRLPSIVHAYIRLVGPAILTSLAAVSVMVLLDPERRPTFHVGAEWLAVAVCVLAVALRRGLLVGLVLGTVLIAVLRATGFAAIP